MTADLRPFVDFYKNNGISPVAQDIADLRAHFARREALYRHLGLVPRFLAGRNVIEFGPGSGYNALYTASLSPLRYVLVDGNPIGLERAKELIRPYLTDGVRFVESLVEDYRDAERYDLVICEGVIPFQMDPAHFTRTISSFAAPGGVVVITTIDPVSFLSEVIRRLMAGLIAGYDGSVSARLDALRPFFASHLTTLSGRSRPIDDWILDNVINPFVGKTFAMSEAVESLASDFDVYGSSPDIFVDWRWYKNAGRQPADVEAILDQYYGSLPTLMDCRFVQSPITRTDGERLLRLATDLYCEMQRIEREHDVDAIRACADRVEAIASACGPLREETAEALREAREYLAGRHISLDAFRAWFGRGQQYMSFIRRDACTA